MPPETTTIRSRKLSNFRLSFTTKDKLRELAEKEAVSQRELVERLIAAAHERQAA
jgi:hypothetical protein